MIKSARLRKEQAKVQSALNKLSTASKVSMKVIYVLLSLVILMSVLIGYLLSNTVVTGVLIIGTFFLVKELLQYQEKRELKKIEGDLTYLANKVSNHFKVSNDVLKALDDTKEATSNEILSNIFKKIVVETNILNYSLKDALNRQRKVIDSRLWDDFIKVLMRCSEDNEMKHALESTAHEMEDIKSLQDIYEASRDVALKEYLTVVFLTLILFIYIALIMPEVGSHIFNTVLGMNTLIMYIASIFITAIYNLRAYKPLSELGRGTK